MMRKIFDQFLDKPDPLVGNICEHLDVEASSLLPVRVVRNRGLSTAQLREILGLVTRHGDDLQRSWDEYFGG